MLSTSVQLTNEQKSWLDSIANKRGDRPSNALILREAFEFYVQKKYPELIK